MRRLLTGLLGILPLCACEPSAPGPDRVRIARENAPAVVTVNILKKDGSAHTATGFVLTPDGLIATNRHVTDGALYVNLTFNDGTVSGEAKPVAASGKVDLALLQIQARYLPTVKLGDSSGVQPGQAITVIGNPRRLQNTVSDGVLSQVRQRPDGILWHQISAPLSPSSSGSPVFNEKGEVISVAFGSYNESGNQNLNFAVPANYLLELVQQSGYQLPAQPLACRHAWSCHLQKAWAIFKRPFTKVRSKDPAAARA